MTVDNPDGTTDGTDGVFTVSAPNQAAPGPPTVTTQSPVAVGAYTATLIGAVNPEERATSYHFLYGPQRVGLGSSTAPMNVSAGSTGVAATAAITGLSPGTTFVAELVATNAIGTTIGSSVTFHTAPRQPPVALTAHARRHTYAIAPARYTVTGRLLLPSGLTPARGCRGRVNVQVIAAHSALARVHASISPACTYHATFRLRHLPFPHGRGRVYAMFVGNPALRGAWAPEQTINFG